MQIISKHIKAKLSTIYPPEEVRQLALMILCHACKLEPYQILAYKDRAVSKEALDEVEDIIAQICLHRPIQYILGTCEFFGLSFFVSEDVLIPRPETESLVELILKSLAKAEASKAADKKIRILDIGTGSGCIAIALAKNMPQAQVYALDISAKALEIAKKNARQNDVLIHCLCCDILKSQSQDISGEKFDIIVSNPPYVTEKEKSNMSLHVLNSEPHLALFVPDEDPLLFYNKIASLGLELLNDGGWLYFEISSIYGKESCELLLHKGYTEVQLLQDLSKKDRTLRAKKPRLQI